LPTASGLTHAVIIVMFRALSVTGINCRKLFGSPSKTEVLVVLNNTALGKMKNLPEIALWGKCDCS